MRMHERDRARTDSHEDQRMEFAFSQASRDRAVVTWNCWMARSHPLTAAFLFQKILNQK